VNPPEQHTRESELMVEKVALIHQLSILEAAVCDKTSRLKAIRQELRVIREAEKTLEQKTDQTV